MCTYYVYACYIHAHTLPSCVYYNFMNKMLINKINMYIDLVK